MVDSLNSRKFPSFDSVHQLPWALTFVCDFLNFFQFSRPFTLVRPSLFGVFGNFQFFCIFSPSLVDDRSELIDYSFQLTDIFNVGCIQRLEVRNDVLDEVGFLVAFWSQGEFRRLNDLFDYKDID